MNSSQFHSYKSRYRAAIRQVLAQSESGRLDEAAFPAYAHANPLINWLFWQRLRTVMAYLERPTRYERVLDFGCGSGVMLPWLAEVSTSVTAMDVDLLPLQRMREQIPLAANVEIQDATVTGLAELPAAAYDLVIALDVLEHVPDLLPTLQGLLARLKPDGRLIVSVPTENLVYRIGRTLAGPEYSGAYHERGAAEIKRTLRTIATIEPIATLYWPVPLFELFAARKRAA